ncbi:MAG: hypothetical protein U1B78_03810 [Dehalococcoidia bacterium]|nr:hypothetical protein [Dehalococcoidia bacterium]
MKTRLLMMVLAAPLLAFGGLVVACGGGGGGLTLEEYFEELEQISKDVDDRSTDVEDEFSEDIDNAEDDAEEVELTQAFLDDILSLGEELRDDLEGLDPPDEVADEHDAYVEAVNGALDALQGIADEAEDADSRDDIEALFDEDEFTEAGENVDDTCLDLQEIADDEDIDVDLNCGDDGDGEPAATEELPTLELPTPDTSGAELEDYLFQLEDLTFPFFRDYVALNEQFTADSAAAATSDEQAALALTYLDDVIVLLEDVFFQLADIDAATEASDADFELFSAADDLLVLFEDVRDRTLAGDVTGAEDLSAGAADAPILRLFEACFALQDVADANAISADLGCEG